MSKLISKIRLNLVEFILWNYRQLYIPLKARSIRRKPIIKVAFIIHSLGAWKSESLYKKMLEHPRFNPQLLILKVDEEDDREDIKAYLDRKNYHYIDITEAKSIRSIFKPDIIFYQKPYYFILPLKFYFTRNLKSLFCYVNYGFHGVDKKWSRDTDLLNSCWQIYYENEAARTGSKLIMRNRCKNGCITGLPIMDEFLISKENLLDPWKKLSDKPKRIIWAPHYSIGNKYLLSYSTFLKYSDFMIELAKKYSNDVQWAFKPHPLLRYKLEEYWGKDRTDAYWEKWEKLENAQIESGKYLGLFKYSDAMIHDCGSFTIEYLYTGKPVMYLVNNDNTTEGFNEFQRDAFNLHQKGYCGEDIEIFVKSIIEEQRFNEKERLDFYKRNLIPPAGKSAVKNIIESILTV